MLPLSVSFLLPIFLECGYDSWHSSSHWDHEVTFADGNLHAKDCEEKKKKTR